MNRWPIESAHPKNIFLVQSNEELAHVLMRRGDMADHNYPLTPLKSISLQVAPVPNQAFKSDKIFCREKHSNECNPTSVSQAVLFWEKKIEVASFWKFTCKNWHKGFEPVTEIDIKTRFLTNAKTNIGCNKSLKSLFEREIQIYQINISTNTWKQDGTT